MDRLAAAMLSRETDEERKRARRPDRERPTRHACASACDDTNASRALSEVCCESAVLSSARSERDVPKGIPPCTNAVSLRRHVVPSGHTQSRWKKQGHQRRVLL
eukprot:2312157-Pleurochrysis_carterae.AAC.4